MRVYFKRSAPDLAYSWSRDTIGEPDTLLTAAEDVANGIAELLYTVMGQIFWLAIVWALVRTSGAL
jgi:hypothetical protein